jgi:hypothetical protein
MSKLPGSSPVPRGVKNKIAAQYLPRSSSIRSILSDAGDTPPLLIPQPRTVRRKLGVRRSSLGPYTTAGPAQDQLSSSRRRSRSPLQRLRRTSSLEAPRHPRMTPSSTPVDAFLKSPPLKSRSPKEKSRKTNRDVESSPRSSSETEWNETLKSSPTRTTKSPSQRRDQRLEESWSSTPSASSSSVRLARAMERRNRYEYRVSAGSESPEAVAAAAKLRQRIQQEQHNSTPNQKLAPTAPVPGSIAWLQQEIPKLPFPTYTAYQHAWQECLAAFGHVAVAVFGLSCLVLQPVTMVLLLLLQVPRHWLLATSGSKRLGLNLSNAPAGSGSEGTKTTTTTSTTRQEMHKSVGQADQTKDFVK